MDVQWIKLSTDIFNNRKIRAIEALPDGDAIIVIWLQLLILASQVNDGGYVYFTKEIPFTDQLLATQFRRPLATVQLAMRTFEQFGMVEVINDVILISNWEKYQNTEAMERKKEADRIRQQRHREKLKLEAENVTEMSRVTERDGHAIEKKRIEKNREDIKESKDSCPFQDVVSYLNEKTGGHYKATTPKTQTLIRARVKEGFTLEDFQRVIDTMVSEWSGTEMEKYLRPETLFGTKFEGYLNRGKKNVDEEMERLFHGLG